MGECVLDLSGSGYGPVAVCFKQIIDIWGSIKCGGILLWLRSRRQLGADKTLARAKMRGYVICPLYKYTLRINDQIMKMFTLNV